MLLSLTACCMLGIAHYGPAKSVEAKTDTVRSAKDGYDNFYYYGNGALRSINNLVGSTYNFSESSFDDQIKSYADRLLGEVNYDDTSEVWKKAGSDNLSSLTSVMHMPSKKAQLLTNYTETELKEKGLSADISESSTTDAGTTDVNSENIVDNSEASTSELVSALSYLIDKDYYTVPMNVSVSKTGGKYPVSGGLSQPSSAKSWYYANNKETITNKKNNTTKTVNTSNDILKSDLIMTLSKIYCGVQNSSALIFHDYSERSGGVWSNANLRSRVSGLGNYSVNLNHEGPVAKGYEYYGSTHNYYNKLDGTKFEGEYGDGHFNGDSDMKYAVVEGTDYHGVQFVGDYWVYYDPNVYELYLSEALNDGIITLSDLATDTTCGKFRTDYKNKSTGSWGNGTYRLNGKITSNCLGYSKTVSNTSTSCSITNKTPDYFGEMEHMTMMEALRIIESYMRANDENMSKTEEKIVRYKLGLNILSYLDSDDCSTVTYLIAKGILDGDSSSLSSMLYDNATISRVYPLLYRVANKNARCTFSTIQLTDSETFWATEGFSEDKFSIITTDEDVIHDTGDVQEVKRRKQNAKDNNKEASSLELVPMLSRASGPTVVNAASKSESNVKTYKIVKYFDKKSVYQIGSTTIAKLYKGQDQDEWKKYDITDMELKKDYEYKGKKHTVYVITFEVSASKRSSAIASIDNKITVLSDLDQYKKALAGVTSVDHNGTTTSLVSQTSLKQAFSNITVLEDKVLMNNVTGTMAYFSYDNRIALVGSQVIDSGYSCIAKAGNEVYYNLDAVITLLSSSYLDAIGPQISIITTDVEHTHKIKISTSLMDADDYLMNAQYVKVYTHDTSGEANSDDSGFACIATSDAKKSIASEQHSIDYYLKLNTLSSTTSKLTKSFSVDYNGKKITGTIILDLQYVVPPAGSFSTWLSAQIMNSSTYTYQQASQILCTPPDKIDSIEGFANLSSSMTKVKASALADWWYSNYGMSNALCNFIYGTKDNVYVPSGYVCPSVTLLIDNVNKQSFSKWCAKGGNATAARDAVFKQIFDGFSLGDNYLKYNGGSQSKFWHNYYKCDSTNPNYSDVGFSNTSKDVTSTIMASRRFMVYEQPSTKALKKSKLGKVSSEQGFKTYGIRYAVSATGSVFESIRTLGNPAHPLFSYTVNHKNGENSTLASLKLNSRTAGRVVCSRGDQVFCENITVRLDSTHSSANGAVSYYATYANSLFTSAGKLDSKNLKLSLKKSTKKKSGMTYNVQFTHSKGSGGTEKLYLTSDSYTDGVYRTQYSNIFKQIDTCPTKDTLKSMIESKSSNLFLDPSLYANSPLIMRKIFGSKTIYIYTDKGSTEGLNSAGKLYKWNGNKLTMCKNSAAITAVYNSKKAIYAIPLYLAPRDIFFLQLGNTNEIQLCSNIYNKALNYLPYDLTSINNQIIEEYLNAQQGVVGVNTLENGTELVLGDTVWVKKGKWWQSKPVSDSSYVKVAISRHKDLGDYSNNLFGGTYITVQGRQYALAGYVKSMTMGSLIGSKSQFKKGVVFLDGNTVKVRKGSKVTKANSKTKAQYISIKCKLSDQLKVRPINSNGSRYIYLSHAGTGMISSTNYPFLDAEASWASDKGSMFTITTSSFKPSSAFQAAKENFMNDFKAALVEDSWNYVWVVIMMLAAYLMIMSWFSYGVITLGVGRSGFEALLMRTKSGAKNGIDFIKVFTFGLYSIEREVSLARMVIVSLACCSIILTILILIF